MTDTCCFHCGEPIPEGENRSVEVNGAKRPVCCAGCEAVVGLILGNGLEAFYRFRTGPGARPEDETEDNRDQWAAYDRPEVQREFVRGTDNRREASFLFENLYCAACGWLIEHCLQRIEGVLDIRVNPATGRALISWDSDRVPLSHLLRTLAQLGYRPFPVQSAEAQSAVMRERRAALRRLVVAGLGMMQTMMFGVALYLGYYQDMEPLHQQFLRVVSLLVATPVVLYAALPILQGAVRDLRNARPGMDVPVSLAIFGGYFASVWFTITDGEHVYFDSITMFAFFLLVARFVEMSSRHKANETTDALARLLPATATRLDGNTETQVAVTELQEGDLLLVKPGETIPADGTIVWGETNINEAMLTGESMPQRRRCNDAVIGGTLNLSGAVKIRVERLGQESILSQISQLLERAQAERPRLAQLAQKVGARFVTVILIVSAVVFSVWWHIDPAQAFPITLAVLIATCPCALSLATPTALAAGTNRLASNGLLITRPDTLETLDRVSHVVFDKTGTLTYGELSLERCLPLNRLDKDDCLELAGALERHSEHPIALAFKDRGRELDATEVTTVPGEGIEGVVNGERYRVGTPAFVGALSATSLQTPDEIGSWIALGDTKGGLALFRLQDRLRPGLNTVIERLQAQGIGVSLASGDDPQVVASLADDLGIENWRGRQTPADKLAHLRQLQQEGHVVAMVGDGINDAPVLAGANVSVAMNSGTALAQTSASMVLLAETLNPLTEGIDGARRTLRIMRQNMLISVSYNASVLPLAALGILPPWAAAIGMTLSSLVVVMNASRLHRRRALTEQSCPLPLPTPPQEARA
ncbi:hypothetical protein CAI21_00955 [Alkalilimnicola ehrlichii]|uniref:HMA domain-containing protein n=1 Tax=Alkalilimnicola ehrlichii TaxID=351052 RepID=A0A3E0X1F3_9GAMM|nr:heavy metal translocating P-type ATPase [Alkalilimnicola ehrlichii]RFA31243.1 hypothetical protein CAI21_00955 [Alkalilimnicola ehrlichii]RFA39479.1 hypothetical protein CAL65_01455 [Alkalilimnicola ehrlichii]